LPLAAILVAVAVLSLLAVAAPPLPNGLGLLPSTVALVQRSGVTLNDPSASPAVSVTQAVKVARGQGSQDAVEAAILADVSGANGSSLGGTERLCWVVLLQANPDGGGNLPVPGEIDLYMVLVNAHTGRFLDGVIAFHGPPLTGVGSA
jgi:hypothetical protein